MCNNNKAPLYFIASGIWMLVSHGAGDWFMSALFAVILFFIGIHHIIWGDKK